LLLKESDIPVAVNPKSADGPSNNPQCGFWDSQFSAAQVKSVEQPWPSPYVWASTDQYIRGKYIADGHYDPNATDHQLGCAALLNRMAQMDPTIRFVDTDEIGHQFQSEAA